jgi:CheY-like chemotaxis protein
MDALQISNLEPDRGGQARLFQELTRFRVREILLVSSLYDSFVLSEDGSLYESLLSEYVGLGLNQMPNITNVSSGAEALALCRERGLFDLVICSLQLEDMHSVEMVRQMRAEAIDLPVVLLTYDSRELSALLGAGETSVFDKVFVWQGDFRLLLAIIKCVEDRANIARDTALIGVQTIILVEDNVKFCSSYLPLIYVAVMEHTAELIAEGVNPAHRLVRMRARPKIIVCSTYDEAWEYFERYHETILGVVSDIEFPRGGEMNSSAGFDLAQSVLRSHSDIPVLLQSHDVASREHAQAVGASFLLKDTPTLLHDLKRYMVAHFGFGDFVFRLPDGTVVDRADDLRALEEKLRSVPDESIAFHGGRNDFSRWLKARTEFSLAHRLRPVKVSDYPSVGELRAHLIRSIQEHRRERQRRSVVDFDGETFDPVRSFARVGGGSLGGKGRGLAFARGLIAGAWLEDAFPGVRISVPPSIVLGTAVFDRFLEHNDLLGFAIGSDDDAGILERFLRAPFPEAEASALSAFLADVDYPLSVRSSSLLEDSRFMPFAGVYDTFMLANDDADPRERLARVLEAVRRVYASTFYRSSKQYIRGTPYRLEEEKMAVIIQKLVGVRHGPRYYPDFSGVARSYNFYPVDPMTPEDGQASVAIGLGKHVVEGGTTVQFSPRYPRHTIQFSRVEDALRYGQRTFYALGMPTPAGKDAAHGAGLVTAGLEEAEADGALAFAGSTYSAENHAIYDDVSRPGPRIVTFAPILKNDLFPLAAIIERLLALGRKGMSSHVEIEFAVNLAAPPASGGDFHLLQIRPMVIDRELEKVSVVDVPRESLICRSSRVLGNGTIDNIRDVIVVDRDRFERSESLHVAREVGRLNSEMSDTGAPYILIGVGRWGSSDPWLGIPVRWDEISGARVIVEAPLRDVDVTPSQGAHFFQNLTATRVGYLTVPSGDDDSFVDWEWLNAQRGGKDDGCVRHLCFERPLRVIVDGRRGFGMVLKPGREVS